MLTHVHRLPEEQKRAIVNKWPDPFVLMDELIQMKPDDGVKMISNVMATNGRRVGPAAAKWIYTFLISKDGEDVIIEA